MSIFARVASFHLYELITLIAVFSTASSYFTARIIHRRLRDGAPQSFAKGVATGLGMKIRGAGISLEVSNHQVEIMADMVSARIVERRKSEVSKPGVEAGIKGYTETVNSSSFVPPPFPRLINYELMVNIRDEAERQSVSLFQVNGDQLDFKPVEREGLSLMSTVEFKLREGPAFDFFLNHGGAFGVQRAIGNQQFFTTLDQLLFFVAMCSKRCDGLSTSQYMEWLRVVPPTTGRINPVAEPFNRDTWITVKVSRHFAYYMMQTIENDQPKIKVNANREITLRVGEFVSLVGLISKINKIDFGSADHVKQISLQSDRPEVGSA